MKIVIDIPKETYNFIKENSSGSTVHEAIKNGQPLPKGHGRLIDADIITPKIHGTKSIIAILEAPTIIEAEKEDVT